MVTARRGALVMALPIGLIYDAAGAVGLDPDRQIQETVRLLFTTFRAGGSATAVVRRFAQEGRNGVAFVHACGPDLQHAFAVQQLQPGLVSQGAAQHVQAQRRQLWRTPVVQCDRGALALHQQARMIAQPVLQALLL